jgi:F0F1-type ATP synthase epsilon subunit
MGENSLIDLLEELAEGLGVKIRHEAIKQDEDAVYVSGGLCLLRGEYVLIVNSNATVKDRISMLGTALKHFKLDKVYIRPVVRELLDTIPEQRPFSLDSNVTR